MKKPLGNKKKSYLKRAAGGLCVALMLGLVPMAAYAAQGWVENVPGHPSQGGHWINIHRPSSSMSSSSVAEETPEPPETPEAPQKPADEELNQPPVEEETGEVSVPAQDNVETVDYAVSTEGNGTASTNTATDTGVNRDAIAPQTDVNTDLANVAGLSAASLVAAAGISLALRKKIKQA